MGEGEAGLLGASLVSWLKHQAGDSEFQLHLRHGSWLGDLGPVAVRPTHLTGLALNYL